MATALTVVPHSPAPAALPAFTIAEVERVALAIAKGGLFGAKDPNAVLTLCLLAQAEGQHPATVFRDYSMIQGKPAKKAEAMLRDFVNSGGKVEWHKLDDTMADATFSHPGGGSVRITWDMDRAKKAGLGGKDMWAKYPRQMLRSRTVSEGIRTVYPGATGGLYVPEEVQDFDGGPTPPVNPETGEIIEAKTTSKATDLPEPRVARTKTELKTLLREFGRNLESAGDCDTLETLIDAECDLLAQCRRDLPEWWENENGGLAQLIEKCRAECETADREREQGAPIIAAG